MKLFCFPIVLVISFLNLTALAHQDDKVVGSKTFTTTEFTLAEFNNLKISHGIKVKLVQSDEYKISIKHNDNLKEYLVVKKKGEDLILGLKSGQYYRNTEIEAEIHMPSIHKISLSGASNLVSEMIETPQLSLQLSGASQMKAKVKCTQVLADCSGASNLSLSGNTQSLLGEFSGASDARCKGLEVSQKIDLHGSGASSIRITCHGEMSFKLSGASNLTYYGDGHITDQNVSGASSIRKGVS